VACLPASGTRRSIAEIKPIAGVSTTTASRAAALRDSPHHALLASVIDRVGEALTIREAADAK
jgi:hypothetical protein